LNSELIVSLMTVGRRNVEPRSLRTPGGQALLFSGTSGAPTSALGVPSGRKPHPSTRTGGPTNQSTDPDGHGGGAERHTPAPKWRVLRTPTSGGPPRGVQRAPGEAGRGQRGDKRQRGHEPPPARESAPVQTGTPERATRGEARASEHGSIVRPQG
jgi:hypothetical protein